MKFFLSKILVMMNIISENCLIEENYDIYKLVDKCSHFHLNSFKYSAYDTLQFENDIDPVNNLYNKL